MSLTIKCILQISVDIPFVHKVCWLVLMEPIFFQALSPSISINLFISLSSVLLSCRRWIPAKLESGDICLNILKI